MIFEIKEGKYCVYEPDEANFFEKKHIVGFIDIDESADFLYRIGLNENVIKDCYNNKSIIFESRSSFDIIGLSILNNKSLFLHNTRVCVVFSKNTILFLSGNISSVEKLMHDIAEGETAYGFDRILSTFFERLIQNDVDRLDDIEQEIANLENALISSKKKECVKEIIHLRKKLLILKRYYEQLLNVLDEIQQNENNTLHGNSLRYFKIIAGKIERLYHSVLNLRDYVTQVREAYQAEVDISLNNIMKIFTVITAIFLPLTLLVGWYGMNLKMPEFAWDFGYAMVIILSIVIVVVCLFIFKKRKWF